MSIYKEGFRAIQLISRSSVMIYPDACDYGAPTKKNDNIWNMAKQLVDWYGVKNTRKEEKGIIGTTVSTIVKLQNEWSDLNEYVYYKITYVTCKNGKCKDKDGFIYIEQNTY